MTIFENDEHFPPVFETPPLLNESSITSIHNISFLIILLANLAWTCIFAIRRRCFASPSRGIFTLIRLLLLYTLWLSSFDIRDRIFYLLRTFLFFIFLDAWQLYASWLPRSYVTTTTRVANTTTRRNGVGQVEDSGLYDIEEDLDGENEQEILDSATNSVQWQYTMPLMRPEDYDDPNVKALCLDLRPRTARWKPVPDSSGIFAGEKT